MEFKSADKDIMLKKDPISRVKTREILNNIESCKGELDFVEVIGWEKYYKSIGSAYCGFKDEIAKGNYHFKAVIPQGRLYIEVLK